MPPPLDSHLRRLSRDAGTMTTRRNIADLATASLAGAALTAIALATFIELLAAPVA
jgi:hypothetical protein